MLSHFRCDGCDDSNGTDNKIFMNINAKWDVQKALSKVLL
jgi:hypothetical protein